MVHSIIIKDLDSIERAAAEFIQETQGQRLIAFYAAMGAGKTTFSKALCATLGINSDDVSSPTFAIVNEYRRPNSESVYHFDFYRITKNSEALDIGLYDYLDSGCYCLMEWPENIEDLLPEETLKVRIEVEPDNSRILSWED